METRERGGRGSLAGATVRVRTVAGALLGALIALACARESQHPRPAPERQRPADGPPRQIGPAPRPSTESRHIIGAGHEERILAATLPYAPDGPIADGWVLKSIQIDRSRIRFGLATADGARTQQVEIHHIEEPTPAATTPLGRGTCNQVVLAHGEETAAAAEGAARALAQRLLEQDAEFCPVWRVRELPRGDAEEDWRATAALRPPLPEAEAPAAESTPPDHHADLAAAHHQDSHFSPGDSALPHPPPAPAWKPTEEFQPLFEPAWRHSDTHALMQKDEARGYWATLLRRGLRWLSVPPNVLWPMAVLLLLLVVASGRPAVMRRPRSDERRSPGFAER
jgi:hypothetical protein